MITWYRSLRWWWQTLLVVLLVLLVLLVLGFIPQPGNGAWTGPSQPAG